MSVVHAFRWGGNGGSALIWRGQSRPEKRSETTKKTGPCPDLKQMGHSRSRGGCLFVFVVEKHIYIFRGHEKNHPFWRESNNCKIYDDFEGFPLFFSAGNIMTPCIYSFKGTCPTSNFSLSQRSFDEKNRCTRCSVWSLQGWEEKEKEEEKTLGAQLLMEELEWIGSVGDMSFSLPSRSLTAFPWKVTGPQ